MKINPSEETEQPQYANELSRVINKVEQVQCFSNLLGVDHLSRPQDLALKKGKLRSRKGVGPVPAKASGSSPGVFQLLTWERDMFLFLSLGPCGFLWSEVSLKVAGHSL